MQKKTVVAIVSAVVVLILSGCIVAAVVAQPSQGQPANDAGAVAVNAVNDESAANAAADAAAPATDDSASAQEEGSASAASSQQAEASGSSVTTQEGQAAQQQADQPASAPVATAPQPERPAASVVETPKDITVHVLIDASRAPGYGIMDNCSVTVPVGSSVYDALLATGASVSGSSSYVRAINGLAERLPGYEAGSGWLYLVDGSRPSRSCGSYVLQGGEDVQWVYTLDMGNDL